MSVVLLRILSFCLFPLGVYLLVKGIRLLLKFANATKIFEMPMTQTSAEFTVEKDNEYAIWQAGQSIFANVPLEMKPPIITDTKTGDGIQLHFTSSRIQVNNGSSNRFQMFTFYAKAGHYSLAFTDQPASTTPLLSRLQPSKKAKDVSSYSLQIREAKPGYLLVFAILLTILAAAMTICGIAIPLNAEKFFN